MSFFTRRGRRERQPQTRLQARPQAQDTSASTAMSAGGIRQGSRADPESSSLFLAYLCPVGQAPTASTPFVKLQVNAQDLTTLVTRACKAPPLTALDELSGCFYDIRFISSSEPSELVACATFSQRNEI